MKECLIIHLGGRALTDEHIMLTQLHMVIDEMVRRGGARFSVANDILAQAALAHFYLCQYDTTYKIRLEHSMHSRRVTVVIW
jgi:hypothetical protein